MHTNIFQLELEILINTQKDYYISTVSNRNTLVLLNPYSRFTQSILSLYLINTLVLLNEYSRFT